jgi:hypothetical protein
MAQLLFPDDAHWVRDTVVNPCALIHDREPFSPRFPGPYYYF